MSEDEMPISTGEIVQQNPFANGIAQAVGELFNVSNSSAGNDREIRMAIPKNSITPTSPDKPSLNSNKSKTKFGMLMLKKPCTRRETIRPVNV